MATSVMPSRELLVARTCQKLLRLALLENVSRLSPAARLQCPRIHANNLEQQAIRKTAPLRGGCWLATPFFHMQQAMH